MDAANSIGRQSRAQAFTEVQDHANRRRKGYFWGAVGAFMTSCTVAAIGAELGMSDDASSYLAGGALVPEVAMLSMSIGYHLVGRFAGRQAAAAKTAPE